MGPWNEERQIERAEAILALLNDPTISVQDQEHFARSTAFLFNVAYRFDLPIGAPVMAGEREAGRLFTRAGDRALAHLRLDRAEGPMTVAGVAVTLDPDSP